MRLTTKLRPPALLPVILFTSLFTGTQAFFPSDWRERFFGAGGVSHEAQTRNAYNDLAEKYFPDITPITTNMIKARTAWAEANMKVDDNQTASALHFDGENFEGGQAILVEAKENVIKALQDGNGEAARDFLGAALHTVQDFYSHTNWVELGRTDISYDLGKAGVDLTYASFDERTCNECGFGGARRLLLGCHDCTTNTNGFTSLTSGYYHGEDVPEDGAEIPDWKCHHGGATDSPVGAIAGVVMSDVFSSVPQGINKDSLNCFWSPHDWLHLRAVELATKASIQYIEDVIEEGALSEKQKKLLFGVGTTLAFAIDTTGSMSEIIAATRDQAIAIARSRNGTKDEPIDYVVSPFNDPFTGPVSKTPDFDTFVANINSLSAFGGGDCPELSLAGIIDALNVMDGPSELFVMTDAAAKDESRISEAVDIATDKRIRIHVFKFDSGCDDGLASKRDVHKRVDSASNRVYSLIAASTGGTYHSLPTTEVDSISTVLDSLTLSDSNAVLKLSGSLDASADFDVPVDSKMTESSISLRGAGVSISLAKPDGTAVDLSGPDVTLSTVSDGQFLSLKNPVSGIWKLTINIASGSTGASFTCDVSGVSPLHLSSFDFVTLSGRPGHRGYYPISGQPAYDHDVAAIAVLNGDFGSAVLDLRDSLAVHAVDTQMSQGTGAEGSPPRNSFYGEMRLLNQPLYAYAEGTDDAGAPFLRVLPTVFQALLSGTNETGFNNTDIFAGRNTTNVTLSSSTILPSSTSTFFNHTSTLPSYKPTSVSNTTMGSYPPNSTAGTGASYDSSSASSTQNIYYTPEPHTHVPTTYYPTSSGYVKTHTDYATEGCDSLTYTAVTTVTSYTVTDDTEMPYVTSSTVTVTKTVPVLCKTCTGENYPHHTGSGPWEEEDKSVIVSGYGDYYTGHATASEPAAAYTNTAKLEGEHYDSEASGYPYASSKAGQYVNTHTSPGNYEHYPASTPASYPTHAQYGESYVAGESYAPSSGSYEHYPVSKPSSYPASAHYGDNYDAKVSHTPDVYEHYPVSTPSSYPASAHYEDNYAAEVSHTPDVYEHYPVPTPSSYPTPAHYGEVEAAEESHIPSSGSDSYEHYPVSAVSSYIPVAEYHESRVSETCSSSLATSEHYPVSTPEVHVSVDHYAVSHVSEVVYSTSAVYESYAASSPSPVHYAESHVSEVVYSASAAYESYAASSPSPVHYEESHDASLPSSSPPVDYPVETPAAYVSWAVYPTNSTGSKTVEGTQGASGTEYEPAVFTGGSSRTGAWNEAWVGGLVMGVWLLANL